MIKPSVLTTRIPVIVGVKKGMIEYPEKNSGDRVIFSNGRKISNYAPIDLLQYLLPEDWRERSLHEIYCFGNQKPKDIYVKIDEKSRRYEIRKYHADFVFRHKDTDPALLESSMCHNCGISEALLICDGCSSVVYCGDECREKDWVKCHNATCEMLK